MLSIKPWTLSCLSQCNSSCVLWTLHFILRLSSSSPSFKNHVLQINTVCLFQFQTELIDRAGYKSEKHVVESQDGFRVTVFRIPGPGTPVLLMHGLFVASDSWVLRGKGRDLGTVRPSSNTLLYLKLLSLLNNINYFS